MRAGRNDFYGNLLASVHVKRFGFYNGIGAADVINGINGPGSLTVVGANDTQDLVPTDRYPSGMKAAEVNLILSI